MSTGTGHRWCRLYRSAYLQGARKCGYRPVVYDNLVSGHREAVALGPFRPWRHRRSRRSRCRDPDISSASGHSFSRPMPMSANPLRIRGSIIRNNLAGSLTLLEALRDGGVGHFVLSSTCAVYGEPADLPITEQTPPRPINPYGASKLMVEHMLADFERAHDLHWLALRYFNAAGDDFDEGKPVRIMIPRHDSCRWRSMPHPAGRR